MYPKNARTTLKRLPTSEEGVEGLDTLIEAFGIDNVQMFLRYIRDDKNSTTAAWIAGIAQRQIRELMDRNPDYDEREARLKIAPRWGYTGRNLSNFSRMLRRADAPRPTAKETTNTEVE